MERLKATGFRAPALIAAGSTPARTLRALGMKLPDTMTADSIAEALGRSHKCGAALRAACVAALATAHICLFQAKSAG